MPSPWACSTTAWTSEGRRRWWARRYAAAPSRVSGERRGSRVAERRDVRSRRLDVSIQLVVGIAMVAVRGQNVSGSLSASYNVFFDAGCI